MKSLMTVTRMVIRTLRPRPFALDGRVVMISGGSRGLGLAIAREAARKGARLVLLARDPDELAEARRELEGLGVDALCLRCDVRRRLDVREAVLRAVERFDRVDVLVNDAGVIEVGPLEAMTEEDFDRTMATNFGGPLNLVYEVVPRMLTAGGGRIVNVASLGGLLPVPHLGTYCASKFALVGLSQALQIELAKDDVRVTTVCPGLMRTGSGRAVYLKGNPRADNAWFRASALAPLLSMSAPRAARRILRACERGEGLVVLGAPARAAFLASRLLPRTVSRALSVVAVLLPARSDAHGAEAVRGAAVPVRPSWLQRLDDRYARAFNEGRAGADGVSR